MTKSQARTQPTAIRPLTGAFFARDPRRVARELLGKVLVRPHDDHHGSDLTARIVEVEAYLGEKDPAAHTFIGRTPRNAVLFGPPGHAYVYFIYGNYFCLNVSCEPEGLAGGVLFRALEPMQGIEQMARARRVEIHSPRDLPKLTSGPGKLSQALGITRARDNGADLTSRQSSLWIGDDGFPARAVLLTPRIGIKQAVDRKLRYLLAGNRFVSGPKALGYTTGAARKNPLAPLTNGCKLAEV